MANKAKAADLIGKVLVLGNNVATYTIISVQGDLYTCTFEREGLAPMNIPMTQAAIEAMVAGGKVHWADATGAEETTGEEVDEMDAEDISEEPVKPKAKTVKIKQPKKATAKAVTSKGAAKTTAKGSKYLYATYTTKSGKMGGKILGFAEDDAIYQAGPLLHASKTWERKDGKRVYALIFGPRYTDAAKELCDALNEGAGIEELKAIVDDASDVIAEKRAQQKKEYFERKAEREAAKATKASTKTAKAAKAAAKGEKLYTEAEVKERIRSAFEALAKAIGQDVSDFEPLIAAA